MSNSSSRRSPTLEEPRGFPVNAPRNADSFAALALSILRKSALNLRSCPAQYFASFAVWGGDRVLPASGIVRTAKNDVEDLKKKDPTSWKISAMSCVYGGGVEALREK